MNAVMHLTQREMDLAVLAAERAHEAEMERKFLRSTGQIAGSEGQRRWTVLAYDCRHVFPIVRVDEPKDAATLAMYSAEELEVDPGLRWRSILAVNLELVPGAKRDPDWHLIAARGAK